MRCGIVRRQPTIELGFHLLAELWLVIVVYSSIPDSIHESDAIPDRPAIEFCEDRGEIHRPASNEKVSIKATPRRYFTCV